NLAVLHAGADAVAGQADIDLQDARLIPAHLHAIDAQECAYATLLDEIRSLVDPDPADPWPRHDQHSGASIGVTVQAYHRAGGVPPIALGEDRAFFDALRRVDARIRHTLGARVIVSGRLVGRAPGGMADTMRRRIQQVDEYLDDRLEDVRSSVRRAHLRACLHNAWQARSAIHPSLAARLGLEVREVQTLMAERYFGSAWTTIEDRSPVLQ